MRRKSLLPLVLALFCGLVVSVGVGRVMQQKPQEVPEMEMEEVLVTIESIDYGLELAPELIKVEKWPKHLVPEGTLKRPEDIAGMRARDTILPGEPIRKEKLMTPEELASASLKIPPGYRVVSVKVSASTTGGNLIQVGDRVDVLVYLRTNLDGEQVSETRTILQDIKIFAVDRVYDRRSVETGDRPTDVKTVSLLVTPDQAETVALAEELGSIRLTIRSPEDDQESDVDGAGIDEIFASREKSNRDAEHKDGEVTEDRRGFLDWLESQNVSPEPEPLVATGAEPEGWTMILVRGASSQQLRFVEGSPVPVITDLMGGAMPAADGTGAATPDPTADIGDIDLEEFDLPEEATLFGDD